MKPSHWICFAKQKMLIVQGTAFNWPDPDHFRVVFLPRVDDLEDSIGRIARYLDPGTKKIAFIAVNYH